MKKWTFVSASCWNPLPYPLNYYTTIIVPIYILLHLHMFNIKGVVPYLMQMIILFYVSERGYSHSLDFGPIHCPYSLYFGSWLEKFISFKGTLLKFNLNFKNPSFLSIYIDNSTLELDFKLSL